MFVPFSISKESTGTNTSAKYQSYLSERRCAAFRRCVHPPHHLESDAVPSPILNSGIQEEGYFPKSLKIGLREAYSDPCSSSSLSIFVDIGLVGATGSLGNT